MKEIIPKNQQKNWRLRITNKKNLKKIKCQQNLLMKINKKLRTNRVKICIMSF